MSYFRIDPLSYLAGGDFPLAVANLRSYLDKFSGRHFERIAATSDPDAITTSDLVAVSMLGVNVPPEAAAWYLGEGATSITQLLGRIPTSDVALWDDKDHLSEDGPAWELFYLLTDDHFGVGRTKATKLMAAKRPHLVPIYDSVIGAALGIGPTEDDWAWWREALCDDAARSSVEKVRAEVPDAAPLSLLRTLDIVVWMAERD